MVYATPEDYISFFTVRDAATVTAPRGRADPDEARIERHLQSASRRMDSYIGTRYVLPLTDIPEALRDYCCDIARFLMTGTEHRCTDEIRIRYEDAISWLQRVAAGKVSIGTSTQSGATVDVSSPDVEFYSDGQDLWSRKRTGGGCY